MSDFMPFDGRAFNPGGATVVFSATTGAGTAKQVSGNFGPESAQQYRIHNGASALSFVAFGATQAEAEANLVIPTAGAAAKCYPLPANMVEVMSAPKNAWWAAIVPTGTATIYITPGVGL